LKESVWRPHQKLLAKALVLGAEINIDPQGIFVINPFAVALVLWVSFTGEDNWGKQN
jgi:hypothetical protein